MSTSAPPPAAETAPALPAERVASPLRMQLVIRKDLDWPTGPLMAQVAHAATAVMWEFRDEQEVVEYAADLKGMRKLVYQTSTLDTLVALSQDLNSANPPVKHHLWTEQPEDIPTALAIVPNRSDSKAGKTVKKLLKKAECVFY